MSDILEIEGGRPLEGTVHVSGAKNEVTKLMAAATLFHRPLTLINVPNIEDVNITTELLHHVGVAVHHRPERKELVINPHGLNRPEAIYGEGRGNRLSILLAGPLLSRFGKCIVEKPGGCRIGERPLDLHLYYLRQLGIKIDEDERLISLSGKLRGGMINFPYKSVGATEGALLAAVYADGETVIINHANEPEIVELIRILQLSGALIEYDAENGIHITGVNYPLAIDYPIEIIGDRVEAVSYATAALATNGHVILKGIDQRNIITALTNLRKAGGQIDVDAEGISIKRNGPLKPVMVETDPHPAFATDFQQPFVVLLSQAKGLSRLHETVFEKRFAYTEQLAKMGGDFTVTTECDPFKPCKYAGEFQHQVLIKGPMHFHGGEAHITDLRAAFALVMAGLLSEHPTTLMNAEHLLRGYDHPVEKLRSLGAKIKLIES